MTGSVRFGQPLAPNLHDVTVKPLDYSFNGGLYTRSPAIDVMHEFEGFSTDASGRVNGCAVRLGTEYTFYILD